jgi:hypothetical protein
MNAGKGRPQEPTSSYGATTGSFTGRLPAILTAGTLTGLPPHLPLTGQRLNHTPTTPTLHALRQLVPRLLTRMHVSPFATLAEVDVSTRPVPMPEDGGGRLDQVKGANLLGRNLRYANAAGAFLVMADLRQADLVGGRYAPG